MNLDKNTVAIVTGGASGLGEATVKLLRESEVNVVIADMNQTRGNQLSKTLNCSFFKTNVAQQQSVIKLFKFVQNKYQKVHLVVNCAGVYLTGFSFINQKKSTTEAFQRLLKINVIGTFNVSKYAALVMSKQQSINGQRGVIINVASIAGHQGSRGQVMYAATKGAILSISLPMARDLGKLGIRVMSISPGLFMTPMANNHQAYFEPGKKQTVLGRFGNTNEFAQGVVSIFKNKFMTGTDLRIDGGIRIGYL